MSWGDDARSSLHASPEEGNWKERISLHGNMRDSSASPSLRLGLADDSNLTDVRGRIVDPKIIAEFSNQLFGVFRGVGFNTHPQELPCTYVCHL